MLGSDGRSPLIIALLRPVMIVVEQMGYGLDAHNWRASILVAIVGSIFYGAIAFVTLLLIRKR